MPTFTACNSTGTHLVLFVASGTDRAAVVVVVATCVVGSAHNEGAFDGDSRGRSAHPGPPLLWMWMLPLCFTTSLVYGSGDGTLESTACNAVRRRFAVGVMTSGTTGSVWVLLCASIMNAPSIFELV